MVSLAVDGKLMGHIIMADALRSGTADLLAGLRRLGITRILLATGDRRAVAEAVTAGLGLDAVRADLTPDQKVLLVLTERKNGPVMMVGDGVNDAPALAAADICEARLAVSWVSSRAVPRTCRPKPPARQGPDRARPEGQMPIRHWSRP